VIVVAAIVYFVVAAIRSKRKQQPEETVVEDESPSVVLQYKEEVQSLIDRFRRELESSEESKGCKSLGLRVIGKVEDVTSKMEHQEVDQYWRSMMIRLEGFRGTYRGEPSYEYNCKVSKGVELSNTLIDAILNHLQGRIGDA
jgi:hypothetical protein